MTTTDRKNTSSPSTTWEWRRVKIGRPPEAHSDRGPQARRWHFLARWDPRKPLTLKVTYRGGSECWYEIHGRGAVERFPGHTALHDVMQRAYGRPQSSSSGPTGTVGE